MNADTESQANHSIAAWDRRLAAPLFVAALLSLVFLAGMLHLHEHVEDAAVFYGCVVGSFAVYPAFLWEAALRWRQHSPRWKWSLLYCLLPPLRLAARDHAAGTQRSGCRRSAGTPSTKSFAPAWKRRSTARC